MQKSRMLRLLVVYACIILGVSLLNLIAPVPSALADGIAGTTPPPPMPDDSLGGENSVAPDSSTWTDTPVGQAGACDIWGAVLLTTLSLL